MFIRWLRSLRRMLELSATNSRRERRARRPRPRPLVLEQLEDRTVPSIFVPQATLISTPGSQPFSVGIGDLNGDGKQDMVIGNGATPGLLNIEMGNGNGTFQSAGTISIGAGIGFVRDVAVVNLDGGQFPDLVATAFSGNKVVILQNTTTQVGATPTFAVADTISVGAQPFWLTTGDFSGDGKLDVVTGNFSGGSLTVLPNTTTTPGNITFGTPITISTPSVRAVETIEINGKLDLVAANMANGTLSIFQNTSTGPGNFGFSLASTITLPSGSAPNALAIADFNNDGLPDIAVGSFNTGNIYLLLNQGNGTFSSPTTIASPGGANTVDLIAGDFNGDGNTDLAVVGSTTNMLSVLYGNGAGAFPTVETYATGGMPWKVASGDFNGDGAPDLVVANLSADTATVYLNQSAATALQVTPSTTTPNVNTNFTVTVAAQANGTTYQNYNGTVTLSDSNGILGTHTFVPSDHGSYTFTVSLPSVEADTLTATDGTLTGTAELNSTDPAITLSSGPLAPDTINIPYATQTISASGGTGALTLTTNVTNAVAGLVIPSTGTGSIDITGEPTATGTETFSVTATDAYGGTTTTGYSINVNPAPTLTALPAVADTTGLAYNQTITASGGTGSVTLSIDETNHVAGFNIPASSNTNSAIIGGTPTASGTETFAVTATDSLGSETTTDYSITVLNPVPTLSNVSTTSVLDNGNQATLTGTINAPATQPITLNVNWGDSSPTQTFNLAAGTTTFSETHTYSTVGTDALSVTVGDSDYSNDLLYGSTGGASAGQLYVFDLANDSTTLVRTLPGSNVTEITANTSTGQDWLEYGNNDYAGQQFDIDTGAAIGSPVANVSLYNFNALTYIGNTLYATGTPLTGGTSPSTLFTLDPTTGTATLIGATGINGPISGIAYDAANSTLYGIEGGSTSPYNLVSLNLSTGAATVLFSAGTTSFGSLSYGPDGNLYAGTSTGVLYEINVAGQTVTPLSFTALPSAVSGLTMGNDTATVSVTVNPALTLTSALPAGAPGFAYNQTISAAGGTGAVSLTVHVTNAVSGLLIPGSGTGSIAISGTPTATGTEAFSVTATDSAGGTTTTNYSITVDPPLIVASHYDSALYVLDSVTGALVETLNAPTSSTSGTLAQDAGVTVGPDGNVYLSSQAGNSIAAYNLATNTLSTFISTSVLQAIAAANGDAKFAPAGLRFGPDGNLYVSLNAGQSAHSGGAVIRFDISNSGGVLSYAGTYQTVASGLVQPTGLAFGTGATNDNTLYVSNSGGQNVYQITHADSATPTASVFIAKNTAVLNYPSGLVWGTDGNLYVVDLGATNGKGQILQYSASGVFQEVFSATGSLTNAFPSDAVFLPNGELLTANLGLSATWNLLKGSIAEFSATGALVTPAFSATAFPAGAGGVTGTGPTQLILNAGNQAPTAVSAGGAYTITIGTGLSLNASATDAAGNSLSYSWDINGDDTFGDATSASPSLTWAQLNALGITGAGTFNVRVEVSDGRGQVVTSAATTLTVNPAVRLSTTTQTVVASSFFDSAVYEFDGASGALLKTLVAPNSQAVLSGPSGMTVGPDGNLYFASENNGAIVAYNFSTQTLSTFISASQLAAVGVASDPSGLAFGPDGNLYVSLNNGEEAFTGGSVVRFNISSSGGQLAYAGTYVDIDNNFVQPTELAFGANTGDSGNLYVSDASSDSVVKIAGAVGATPSGSTFVSAGSGGLNYPSGLTWSGGNLYVTDLGATAPNQGQVLVYNSDGSFNSVFTQPASSPLYQFPSDALFLPNGDLLTANLGATYPVGTPGVPVYIAIGTSGSISEFGPTGTFTQALSADVFPANPSTGVTNFSPSQLVLDSTAPSTLSTVVLAPDTVGVGYNQTITALGGTGTVNLAVSAIVNPAGLTIPASGVGSLAITGTPMTAGTVTFTVTATDADGSVTTTDYSITVNPALTLSPSNLPADALNVAYNQSIAASHGTGAITLTVSDIQNAIAGLSVPKTGTSSLTISGTPTVAGTETFMVTATDAVGGTTGPQQYSITVNPASTLTLTPTTVTPGAVSSPYGPINFSASGGFGAYTFTLVKGNVLPPGLTLVNGSLSGTPSTAGAYSFTVVATDNSKSSLTGQLKYSITVTPALVISPTTLAVATVGDKFSTQLTATGGSGKGYAFTASGLPGGLALSSAGLLSGTPTVAAGSPFNVTVTVTDSNSVSRNFSYALTVDPALAVTSGTLPVATVGDKYSTQLTATGGSGKSYAFTAAGLPTWLTLSSTGLLSGTPPATVNSAINFTVTVTDSLKATGSNSYTLNIDPSLVLSPVTLTVVTVGNSFSTQLTAAGGSGAGYTFKGTGLPAWMTLSSSGLLGGTPTTATGSPFHFTVTATDSNAGTVSQAFALTVNPALGISPITAVATVGDNFSTQLTAIGGSGKGYGFTASGLPGWLTQSSTGLLSGMPPSTTGSPLNFTVTVTDSNNASGNHSFALTIDPALAANPGTLPVATVDDKYSTQLTATGGSGKSYAFTAAGLPTWLTLSSTGLLSGTPPATVNSAINFTVTLTDSLKATGSNSYTLNVDPALVLSPVTLTVVTVGNSFSTQLTAAGGSGAGYIFKGTGLPAWMTLSSSGLLGGTPTTATGSPFHFTVTATDSEAGTVSQAYALTVNPALGISPITAVATVGDNFSTQLTGTGGSGKGYAFAASGLPTWLTLSSTGLLSGMPPSTTGSPLNFTVTVTDSNNASGNHSFALTIDPALAVTSGTLPMATVGDKYSTQLTATGGSGKSYAFTAAGLPTWLTLSSTGLLSGTPPATVSSAINFTVTLTDSLKATGSSSYTLNIDPALVLSPVTLTVVTVGNSFSTQLTAAGGSGAGYTFKGTGLPAWMTLSSSGLLGGTPTTATGSPFHFTVTATDSEAGTVSQAYALTVNPALGISPITAVATVGDNFSTQLTGTGGSGKGYAFAASGLPSWLTLSSTGLLSGMPPSTTGSPFNFTVTVTDSNDASGNHSFVLTVDPALALSPATLPVATVGDKYSTQLTATGGSGAGYKFTEFDLPAGLTLSSSGLLSGTPTTATGSPFFFTVTVTDSKGGTVNYTYSITVNPGVTTSPPPAAPPGGVGKP